MMLHVAMSGLFVRQLKGVNMQTQGSKFKRLSLLVASLATAGFMLSGCGGGSSDSTPVTTTAAPTTTTTVIPVVTTTTVAAAVVDAGQLTFDDLKNRALDGKILSVDTSGNQPVVKFQVVMKDTNQGLKGLRTFALHVAQLKPAVDGSASYWLNYLSDGLPLSADPTATAVKTNPSVDGVSTFNADGTLKAQGYKVVDGGDGSYTVTFGANIKANTKVPYDASLTHRVVVGVRGVAVPGIVGKTPGAYAGPVNPLTGAVFAQFTNTNGANFIYDFAPSASGAGTMLTDSAGKQTFARDNVTVDACNACHYKIQYGFPRGNNTSGHFGSRTDTKTCVMCHTPQNTAGKADFTSFIHKIHMGEELAKTEVHFWNTLNYNEVKFPQDIRNCAKCHKGTVVDSWKKPTIKACGACHNNVDFAKGTAGGHVGGAKTDDKTCTLCHAPADIATFHVPVQGPDANSVFSGGNNNNTNASYLAATGVVPAGAAKITYAVSGVTVDSKTGNPSITFKLMKDGTDVVFNAYPAKAELIDNFVGSPSVYFAWSVPQDGIVAPADYNASASAYIKNVWRGDDKNALGVALAATDAAKGAKMTGPVAGYYTITLTGTVIPATAKMLTGGVGYTYGLGLTMPLTQTNVSGYPYKANAATVNSGVGGVGGLAVPPPNVWKVATGFTGRRLITDTAKCNACHDGLGVKPTFHAGQRNDAQTCTFCHNVNRTNSGWPVNINYDVHAIHNGNSGQRVNKFSWEANAGAKFWEVGYPGLLKNCEQCHIAGMYDYSNTVYTSVVPNLLMTTAASGTISATGFPIITGLETVTSTSSVISPFVTPGTAYGAAFVYTANNGASTPAAATTLVLSPISAACSGCHDSTIARAHMQSNGGTVFGPRSDALGKTEQCLVCHGPANNAAFNETVPAIKTVHRWW
jgi:OmcA/MtrC family decaheme c-type cytochrome